MPALRLMTFNVQMLPWLADALHGTTNDAPDRADGVADAILALPADDQPDVIAFNEVFDEDGRKQLLSRLRGGWPNVVEKIDNGGLLEDSGLMLFSRLPFQLLPDGQKLLTGFYEASADTDAFSQKGFGVVQVNAPVEATTIVFTHLQASYATEDEHREIRMKQFDQIHDALTGLLGTGSWRNVVLVGDLNVRGDGGAQTDEWATVVAGGASSLFTKLDDGWRTYMHPPADPTDVDPGFTNIEFDTGKRQRLDYQCVAKASPAAQRDIVPHHLRTRLRNASDHWSLESVIQRRSPHCTPSDAVDLLGGVPVIGGSAGQPSAVRRVFEVFAHDGSYQWIFVSRPGTFTVHTSPDVEHELYAVDDLTHPLDRLDHLTVSELPPSLQPAYERGTVDPKGSTYVSRTPFFIASRIRGGGTGTRTVMVLEHLGETPETAIRLRVHDTVESGFPAGQKLGADDTCWFKAYLPPTYASTARTEHFVLHNPTGGEVKLTRHDAALGELAQVDGPGSTLELTVGSPGDELVLLSLRRADDSLTGFTVEWTSPVSYLMLEQPLGLYVDDETGPDWAGDDEILMTVFLDGDQVLDGSWDDADSGERWPGLAEAITQKIWARFPGVRRMGFVTSLDLSYVEDDVTAAGYQTAIMTPLGPGEQDEKQRRVTMPVPDDISDGRYTFYATLSRFPG